MEEREIPCNHCRRLIPERVIELHSVHCMRFLCVCSECGDLLPKTQLKTHIAEEHYSQTCPYCADQLPVSVYASHMQRCELKPRLCSFCNLEFPFEQMIMHTDICANRTEKCTICGTYVPKREFPYHVVTCRPGENGGLKRKRKEEGTEIQKKAKKEDSNGH